MDLQRADRQIEHFETPTAAGESLITFVIGPMAHCT